MLQNAQSNTMHSHMRLSHRHSVSHLFPYTHTLHSAECQEAGTVAHLRSPTKKCLDQHDRRRKNYRESQKDMKKIEKKCWIRKTMWLMSPQSSAAAVWIFHLDTVTSCKVEKIAFFLPPSIWFVGRSVIFTNSKVEGEAILVEEDCTIDAISNITCFTVAT